MSLHLGPADSSTYLDHGDVTALNGAPAVTLAFWLFVGPATAPGKIAKGSVTAGPEIVLYEFDAGLNYVVRERAIGGSTIWALATREVAAHVNLWTYLATVYDGSQPVTSRITVYKDLQSKALRELDGSLPQGSGATTTAPTALPNTSPLTLKVGNGSTGAAAFAHVRLWDAPLTLAELSQEREKYWAVRQTNLVMDCPFDDQLAARDYSGHGHHGTWNPTLGTPQQRFGPPLSYGGKVLVTG